MDIDTEIAKKAEQVAEILGWKINKNSRVTQLINYPYSISIGRERKMIAVRMSYHPRLHPVEGGTPYTRMVLPLNMTPSQIAQEIEERFLPRVKATVDDMLETQDLIPAW